MQIIIVGSMGAGKTTIGRALAKKLSLGFFDIDHEVVDRCGVDIPTIFDIEGESGFRSREQQILDDICKQKNVVIATGGGAILNEKNREIIKKADHVIYLAVSVNEQLIRTSRDRNRPLLQSENPRAILENLAIERRPLYASVATHTYHTDGLSTIKVTNELIRQLKLKRTQP